MTHRFFIALAACLTSSLAWAANPEPLLKIDSAAQPLAPDETPSALAGFETLAKTAILIDGNSGNTLYEKAADERLPPASMGKMMTVYVAFDLLQSGQIKLTDEVTVQPETWKKWNNQGSTMFLSVNQKVKIEDLLHGIITLSGNDACVVLAEGIAGTEEAYVAIMNQTARKIGLTGSHFRNTTGWPDPEEYTTARDLARLAALTIKTHPALYKRFYPVPSYSFGQTMNGQAITQQNRNPILGRVAGADGLKTGHTEEAGYGFTGSAERNGQRLVFVLTGLSSFNGRQAESIKFIEWGFRTFQHYPIFNKGDVVHAVPVWLGTAQTVEAVAPSGIAATMPRFARQGMKVSVRYRTPLTAPVLRGTKIADLIIRAPGQREQRFPLVAKNSVEHVRGLSKITWMVNSWLFHPRP